MNNQRTTLLFRMPVTIVATPPPLAVTPPSILEKNVTKAPRTPTNQTHNAEQTVLALAVETVSSTLLNSVMTETSSTMMGVTNFADPLSQPHK